MGMINKRLFGSDIPTIIKKKLEARQKAAAQTRNPSEQIKSDYDDGKTYTHGELTPHHFEGEADLSSRTPFIRMWTGVQLLEVEKKEVEEVVISSFEQSPMQGFLDGMSTQSTYALVGLCLMGPIGLVGGYVLGGYMEEKEDERINTKLEEAGGVEDIDQYMKENPDARIRCEYKEGGRRVCELYRPAQIQEIDTELSNVRVYEVGNHTLSSISKTGPYHQITADERNVLNTGPPAQMTALERYGQVPPEPAPPPPLGPGASRTERLRHASLLAAYKKVQDARLKVIRARIDENEFKNQEAKSLWIDENAEAIRKELENSIFPNELGVPLDDNKFFSPPAGIISVDCETEGAMGIIKKTNVKFRVNNFADFDQIYNKYFMRPGAQVFVDFGWSTTDLYDPYKLLESETVETDLYGKVDDEIDLSHIRTNKRIQKKVKEDGYVTRAGGDMETIVGIVTKYDSKINADGTVDCSLELTSKNQAMLTFPKSQYMVKKLDFVLNYLLTYEAIYGLLNQGGNDAEIADLEDARPNAISEMLDVKQFEEAVIRAGYKTMGSNDYNPSILSSLTGVFLAGNKPESPARYISFGLFEDRIINSEFGLGRSATDVNEDSENFSVKSNSSETFVTYNPAYLEKQNILGAKGSKAPAFVLPNFWEHTYSTLRGKGPLSRDYVDITEEEIEAFDKEFQEYLDRVKTQEGRDKQQGFQSDTPRTTIDKKLFRIPLREVFISIDVIIEAFDDDKTTLEEVYQSVCDAINKESYGVMDLHIGGTGSDTEIAIVDKGYNTGIRKEDQAEVFDQMFLFNIHGNNSIVRDYDVTLDIPDGAVGSMYAIQGASEGNRKLYPINNLFDDLICYQELFKHDMSNDRDNIEQFIGYLPSIGDYRATQLVGDTVFQKNWKNLTDDADDMVTIDDSEVPQQSYIRSGADYKGFSVDFDLVDESPERTQKSADADAEADDINKRRNEQAEMSGITVIDSFEDYFKEKIGIFSRHVTRSPLLPLTLSVTIYGVSSIQPGDIFRVDYLPEIYLDKVYFQVTKVRHQIGSDGWYTSLETQFRLRSDKVGGKHGLREGPPLDFILDKKVIEDMNIGTDDWYASPGKLSHPCFILSDADVIHDFIPSYSTDADGFARSNPGGNDACAFYRTTDLHKTYGINYSNSSVLNHRLLKYMGTATDGYSRYSGNVNWPYKWEKNDYTKMDVFNLTTVKDTVVVKLKLDDGRTHSLYPAQSFDDIIKCMVAIKPIPCVDGDGNPFKHISAIFQFGIGLEFDFFSMGGGGKRIRGGDDQEIKVQEGMSGVGWDVDYDYSVGRAEGIIITNPCYFVETGNPDTYNGYGAWHAKGMKTGVFKQGDVAYLIINKDDPQRFWAVSPAIPGYHPSDPNFKKVYDVSVIDFTGEESWESNLASKQDGKYSKDRDVD